MDKSRSPHIAHILPYRAVGGTEYATLRLGRVLRDAGFRNSMFYLKDCNEIGEFFRQDGFEVFQYSQIEPSLRNIKKYWSDSKALARKFSELNVDALHCADLGAAFTTSLAGKLTGGVKVVSHCRNRHDHISRRDRLFLNLVNHWIFVSGDTKKNFGFNVPDKKATVLYDGVIVREINKQLKEEHRESVGREFKIPPETKIIGTLARVAAQKDFFTLAKAVKEIAGKTQPFKVLVVGSTSQEPEHQQHYAKVLQFLKELEITDSFIFTDFRQDTERFLNAFDIFVLSTHYEGFPLVNLEAMAQSIPVVSTDVDGVSEAIKDGQNGLLFRHRDYLQLAAHLKRLLSDSNYAEKLGAAGFESVKANFSNQKYANDVLQFYRQKLNFQ